MQPRRSYRERKYSFGQQLLSLRTRVPLTQAELAQQIGVHRRSVQNWETGESYPKIDVLRRLIACFLQHHAFTAGREYDEATTFWRTAAQDGTQTIAGFDEGWFAGLLHQVAATQAETAGDPFQTSTGARSAAFIDWGEATDVATLYGREHELTTLRTWVIDDRCRVVTLIGLGGIGKSSLALRAAQIMASAFDRVLFRSLQNGPPPGEVIDQIIRAVSEQQLIPPDQGTAKIALLVQLFREQRCLLILDNFESVIQGGALTGSYRSGYEPYGALLHALGDRSHRSCLLLTSREKPAELGKLEGRSTPVRTLSVSGLDDTACQQLLEAKAIVGTTADVQALAHLYGGNPLALALISEPIRELFDGNIQAFLDAGEAFFNGVGMLLQQQFARSTAIEQAVLRWLAIEREAVTLDMLVERLRGIVSRADLIATLESLRRRLLIERMPGRVGFTLQPVILEFVTDQLVEAVYREVADRQPNLLGSHPLVQATAKDYVRHSQEQMIATPLLERLANAYGNADALERQLLMLLASWRKQPYIEQGYGPGNVVNLLRLLRGELRNLDLASLSIRQGYLAEVDAQDTRLVDAHLIDTVLADAFDFPSSVALSGNGRLLASGTSTGQVWLWRVSDRMSQWAVPGHTGGVWGVAFSADDQLVASAGEDGTVRLWEVSSGRLLTTLTGHTGAVWRVALSADGKLVASCSIDGTVRLWEVNSGRLLTTLAGQTGAIRGVALSADGKLVVSAGENGTVWLWDADSEQLLTTLAAHTGAVWSVALSADGRLVASSSIDGTVRLWEVGSEQLLAPLAGHTGGVWGVALSADGQLVASAGEDGMVRLWEAGNGRPRTTLAGHTGAIWGVALSADGQLVASGSIDGTVRLWDAGSGRPMTTLSGHTGGVWGVALSADGQLVASGSIDGTVRLWDADSGRLLTTLAGHTGGVWGVALSADGQLVASGSFDGTVRMWEVGSGRPLAPLAGHTGAVWSATISADSKLIASAGEDGTVRLWEVGSGQPLTTLMGHTGGVWGVALSADGQLVASGSSDGTVRLWDAGSGQPLTTLMGHTGAIRGVTLSADGQLVASGSIDGTVRLWDASSGRQLTIFSGHTGGVWGVALSADGQIVASGSFDGTVRLWEVGSGQPLTTLMGHTGGVWGVALSADGQLVASGSFDGTVRLWEAKRGACLHTLRAERRYERMDISRLNGITAAQRASLIALGAVETQ